MKAGGKRRQEPSHAGVWGDLGGGTPFICDYHIQRDKKKWESSFKRFGIMDRKRRLEEMLRTEKGEEKNGEKNKMYNKITRWMKVKTLS